MNFIKKWRVRREETAVHARLAELWTRADTLRLGDRDDGLPVEEYMTDSEKSEYTKLAYKHFLLCQQLGESSVFFNPKVHGGLAVGGDNSPIALMRVEQDHHREVTFEYDEETDCYYRYVDGVLDEQYGQPSDRMVPPTYPRHKEFDEFYKKEMKES